MVSRMGVICTRKLRTCGSGVGKMNDIVVFPTTCIFTPIVENIVTWCCEYFELSEITIEVYLRDSYEDCWGDSEQVSRDSYGITVCTDQSLRDFVATLCHEMIHVNQWVTGKWEGDGEEECEKRQYELADKYWDSEKIA